MLKINRYFDNKVASINLQTAELATTVGVMDIGEYQFDTQQHEVMTAINGQLTAKLPGSDIWQDFITDQAVEIRSEKTFELPRSCFKQKVPVQSAYFCTYQGK